MDNASPPPWIRVELVYASPDGVIHQEFLTLNGGSSLLQALQHSQLLVHYPELITAPCGVWGRVFSHETQLFDQDRIEIYRPLQAEPKLARQERVKQFNKADNIGKKSNSGKYRRGVAPKSPASATIPRIGD